MSRARSGKHLPVYQLRYKYPSYPCSTIAKTPSFFFPNFSSLSRFNSCFRFSEEWETRKKKEITTTRQIETRVKRQVVLEDGEVVVDSGPLVTTNTTEDVEQQEHTTQEVKLDTVP